MSSGAFPACDWNGHLFDADSPAGKKAGTALAGGYIAPLVALQGDLEYFSTHLQMPRWNAASGCCSLCRAGGSGVTSCKVFDDAPPSKETVWTASSRKALGFSSQAKIFDLPWLSACNVCLDSLHCKYLGTDQYQFASILYILCYHILDNEPATNLGLLWNRIQKHYAEQNTSYRYKYLNKLSMFVRAKGPLKLRGKGAEIKGFGAILLLLWLEFKNDALEIHRMITAMLKLNVEMETILAANKCYDAFPPIPARRFHACANQMAHIQCLLYDRFVDEPGPTLFGVTSKLHSLVHIASLAAFLNPQRVWCFAGEDYMNVCKILCKQCVHGVKPFFAPAKMMSHFQVGMHYQMSP